MGESSVQVRVETEKERDGRRDENEDARKQWVGFSDEMIIVLKEDGGGGQALMVYDFTQ